MAGFSPADHAIALSLIDGVDEGGYLRGDLRRDRRAAGLRRSSGSRRCWRVCQGFEPTGVMARSVPECLKLQLIERNRFDPAMAALLDNLDLLARRDLAALRKVCGVDDEDLARDDLRAEGPDAPARRGLRRRAGPDGDPRRPSCAPIRPAAGGSS